VACVLWMAPPDEQHTSSTDRRHYGQQPAAD
jgi:hypothetical protein